MGGGEFKSISWLDTIGNALNSEERVVSEKVSSQYWIKVLEVAKENETGSTNNELSSHSVAIGNI